ncbi:YeeE/YedE family protein, partial [Rhodovulum sulfidophilum]|nr:YeeE/YedE family protein [Rhodovulum sulfidophilum]
TGPWRRMILQRDASGLVAQMACLALVAAAAFPMLASHPGELLGAHAPVGFAMLGGAFVFGACMQIVLGCGSGTLVNAGSGNLVSVVALPFFCLGSFFGAYHLVWWTGLGALPVAVLAGGDGLALTLVLLASVAGLALALISVPAVLPMLHHAETTLKEFWIPLTTPGRLVSQMREAYPYPAPLLPVVLGLLGLGLWRLRGSGAAGLLIPAMVIGQPTALALLGLVEPVFITRAMVWPAMLAK